jgi:hypothetical protein
VKQHGNQYHIGCAATAGRVRIVGGTFVISSVTRKAMNSANYPGISGVFVTKEADRAMVANKIREVMGIAAASPTVQ